MKLTSLLLLCSGLFAQKPYISPLGSWPLCQSGVQLSPIPCSTPDAETEPALLVVYPSSANTTGFEYHITLYRIDGTQFKTDGYFRRNSVDGASYAVLRIGLFRTATISIVEVIDIAKQESVE